jgi:hypothetical protein
MRETERVVIDGQRYDIPRAWIRAMVVILQRTGHEALEARVLAVLRWHEQTTNAQAPARQAEARGPNPSSGMRVSSCGA